MPHSTLAPLRPEIAAARRLVIDDDTAVQP